MDGVFLCVSAADKASNIGRRPFVWYTCYGQ